jgi:hypothetical protein
MKLSIAVLRIHVRIVCGRFIPSEMEAAHGWLGAEPAVPRTSFLNGRPTYHREFAGIPRRVS